MIIKPSPQPLPHRDDNYAKFSPKSLVMDIKLERKKEGYNIGLILISNFIKDRETNEWRIQGGAR